MGLDWSAVARALGEEESLESGATMMAAGPRLGTRVLERLLGKDLLCDAVETAAAFGPGSGTAEGVLAALRSPWAAEYCHQKFVAENDRNRRIGYASVLRSCAAEGGTSWVEEFFQDADDEVQILGAKMLEGLINCGLVDWDCVEGVFDPAKLTPTQGSERTPPMRGWRTSE